MKDVIRAFILAIKVLISTRYIIFRVIKYPLQKMCILILKAYYYDKKNPNPQDFADDEWHKVDNEFFTNLTDILSRCQYVNSSAQYYFEKL